MKNSDALKTILLLAANPKGTKSLRLQEEEREIKERLRLAGYGKVPINSTEATRPRDIQQAMLDFKPQIVHFSGHGAGEDGLVFEDASGQEKLVSSEALASLFKLFSNRVECVVLNACYSNSQAEAIARHINYVIGMSQAIGDRAAIEFSVGFYTALGAGESIEFAYELGCNAIQLEGIKEHLTPVFFSKSELNYSHSISSKQTPIETSRDAVEQSTKFYIYMSHTKVDMLYSQLPSTFRRDSEAEQAFMPTKLMAIRRYIENCEEVGTIQEPKTYISGTLPLRYGIVTEYASDIAYFGGKIDGQTLSLIGASASLVGAVKTTESNHAPFYYTMRFLNQIVHADAPVNGQPDYYSFKKASKIALGCVPPEKYNLEFLAKVLYKEPNLVVATPLYVAIA